MKTLQLFTILFFLFAIIGGSSFAQTPCMPSYGISCSALSMPCSIASLTGISSSITDPSTSCGVSGANYTDRYATMSVSLPQGSAYTASIGGNSYAYNYSVKIWIDFNDDGVFTSPGEAVGGGIITSTATTGGNSMTLTIPDTAALGTHRMRIVGNYHACCGGYMYASIPSCISPSTNYGETRDYRVVIQSPEASISGSLNVCVGDTATLSYDTTGGTWTSSNTAVATINSTGLVTGVSAGTAIITYALGISYTVATVTVTALPASITGSLSGCVGATTSLSSATTGGTWTSGSTGVATVMYGTGLVTGVGAGTATISYSNGTCAVTAVVTVNSALSSIAGTATVCSGGTTVLSHAIGGGTWSSSSTEVATIVLVSGVVTGVATGTTVITYTSPTGCRRTTIVTVEASPTITGTSSVCVSATITLSSTTAGGTWSSSNTTVATVNSTGIVTGIAAGTAIISYSVTNSCGTVSDTKNITVNPIPAAGTITGPSSVYTGSTISLTSSTYSGDWSSSNTAVATVGTIGGGGGFIGYVIGISPGTAIISCTVSHGCGTEIVTHIVTVNAPIMTPITGALTLCAGGTTILGNATAGGTWSTSTPTVASVALSTGVVLGVSAGTATISYTLGGTSVTAVVTVGPTTAPGTLSGTSSFCVGTSSVFSATVSGGTWSSSNTVVATVASDGIVSGISGGTSAITYTVTGECGSAYVVQIVSILSLPAGISGTAAVCEGATTTLNCSPGGGTWNSGSSTVATISSTGVVTAVSAGTATITYTAATGCASAKVVTVNATPTAITGSLGVCAGSTSALSSTPSGGTWATYFTSRATVNSLTGVIAGVSVGTTPVTYTVGGCSTVSTVTVLATPATIGGTPIVCAGSTTNLTSATTGGTWSSSNTGIASVLSSTGVASGVSAGTATISYSNGTCERTRIVTVNAALGANTGSTAVCVGQSTALNNATTGGTWSSSSKAIATVNALSGMVAGVSAGTVNISYRIGAGCYSITVVTVNTALSSISGTASVCPGATTTLSHSDAGGVWSSSNAARATIDGGTGVVTGITAGTLYITYTLGGCFRAIQVTVNGTPGAIGGTASMCAGATTALTCSPSGGTWSSSGTSIATVSGSGVASGIAAGTATISYIRLGCAATRVVTVSEAPGAIGGTLSACIGTSTTLTSTPGGGTWTSSNAARATVGASTGLVTGVSVGTANITYAISATCRVTAVVTINSSAGAIGGSLTICESCTTTLGATTTGGVWSSSNTAAATIDAGTGVVTGVGVGTTTISYVAGGCASSAVVTVVVAIPSSFGTPVVCVGQTNATMSNPVPGGTWSSSNTSLATIHAVTGLLTGVGIGNPNITYTTSPGVFTITVATVGAAVANIAGTAAVCPGATVSLSNTTAGGTWSSTNTASATVGAGTGVVTGITGGTSTISYFINVGCYKVITQVVNSVPNVTGAANVVNGATTTFGGSPSGGNWSSANPAIASVSGGGVVTGNSVAATTITYTLPATGCFGTRGVNVFASRAGSPVAGVAERAGVLKVFPNPTSGTITIDAFVAGIFTVYTIDGKQVTQYTVGATTQTVSLPQQLAAGVYICRFSGADGTSAIVRLVHEQ